MKFFTSSERRVLLSLMGLLFIGLLVKQGREYFHRPKDAEIAERDRLISTFQERSLEYRETADPTTGRTGIAGLNGPIDVNHAGMDELQILPGIGPVLAKKIVVYREKNGYFQTVQDLIKVKGIGPSLLLRWEGYLVALPDTSVKKGVYIE